MFSSEVSIAYHIVFSKEICDYWYHVKFVFANAVISNIHKYSLVLVFGKDISFPSEKKSLHQFLFLYPALNIYFNE